MPNTRFLQRLTGAIVLTCTVLALFPKTALSEPITEFTTIRELKAQSAGLEKPSKDEGKWFEPESNYGRIFKGANSPRIMLTWLGLLSSDYQLADSGTRITRPVATASGTYRSNRSDSAPIELSVLVPHPRSMSSRKLNLIAEFSDLEKLVKRSENHEQISIAGFPAELAIDSEKQECYLMIDLPRMSAIFMRTKDCGDGKKLVTFSESIDIFHLAEKLEK